MIDIKWIVNNPDAFDKNISDRGYENLSSQEIIKLYKQKKEIQLEIQNLNQERNRLAETFLSSKDSSENSRLYNKKLAEKIRDNLSCLMREKNEVETKLSSLLDCSPNILRSDVPIGDTAKNNRIVKYFSENQCKETGYCHLDVALRLDGIDLENTVVMSGSRFVTFKKGLAKLHRALISFMLDVHTKEFGFEEIYPPCLVSDHAMYNSGHLPKFDVGSFQTTRQDRLVPTSEVTIINMYKNRLLDLNHGAIRHVAATNCFRSEAGSAGRDMRGLIRLHQFSKVELVSVCKKALNEG